MSLLDELELVVKAGVEANRREMDIEGDWEPIAFLATETYDLGIFPMGNLVDSQRSKEYLAEELLPKAIREFKATTMVMLLSAWSVHIQATTPEGESLDPRTDDVIDMLVLPSQHPQRKEVLILISADQHDSRFLYAEISRPEGAAHPELGEWTNKIGDEEPGGESFGGIFWDGPVKALRENHG